MADVVVPIRQGIRNFLVNLPVFSPQGSGACVHAFMIGFYQGFCAAADARGLAEEEQAKVLDRAQRTLWAFARLAHLDTAVDGTYLSLEGEVARQQLKLPRMEETFALMGTLGAQIEYRLNGAWQPAGRLKACEALRLSFAGDSDLPRDLLALAAEIQATTPKEKMAYERFLRANPRSVLALEKPPLDLAANDPAILANLPRGTADAWSTLTRHLAETYPNYAPLVEFRSIQHGMWVANYEPRRGSKHDLCGLIVQNGVITARVILYGAVHFRVQGMLDALGEPVVSAFHQAHWYEEFQHQWLFIRCEKEADTVAVMRLLEIVAQGEK